jgi:hypothetical protein
MPDAPRPLLRRSAHTSASGFFLVKWSTLTLFPFRALHASVRAQTCQQPRRSSTTRSKNKGLLLSFASMSGRYQPAQQYPSRRETAEQDRKARKEQESVMRASRQQDNQTQRQRSHQQHALERQRSGNHALRRSTASFSPSASYDTAAFAQASQGHQQARVHVLQHHAPCSMQHPTPTTTCRPPSSSTHPVTA